MAIRNFIFLLCVCVNILKIKILKKISIRCYTISNRLTDLCGAHMNSMFFLFSLRTIIAFCFCFIFRFYVNHMSLRMSEQPHMTNVHYYTSIPTEYFRSTLCVEIRGTLVSRLKMRLKVVKLYEEEK